MQSYRVILVILGIAALAFALQAGLVAFAGYVLVGVCLLSRFLAKRWMENLAVERIVELPPLEAGDTVTVLLKFKNLGTIPLGWALVEELLPETAIRRKRISVVGRRIQVLFLRPLQSKTVKLKITFHARGYYPIGPTLAETGDVFGLHRRHRILTAPSYAMVLPKIVELPSYDFASERPIGEIRLQNLLYEDPTRTAGVRPYQRGDPLQRIHWRATARTGELHSRIYEPTSLAGATVVVDFHKAGFPKRGEPHRSDLVVAAACALAYAVATMNQQVGFASNGRDAAERIRLESLTETNEPTEDQESRTEARERYELLEQNSRLRPVVVETRRGLDQMQMIREALARLEFTDGSTFANMILEIAPRLPKDATVLCVLASVPVESSIALGMLRRQGYAVSCILIGLADDGSDDRAVAMGRLAAEGIRDVRLIDNEQELMLLGDRAAVGMPADYGFATTLA